MLFILLLITLQDNPSRLIARSYGNDLMNDIYISKREGRVNTDEGLLFATFRLRSKSTLILHKPVAECDWAIIIEY